MPDNYSRSVAYDELLEQRIRRFLNGRKAPHEAKRMMGGLCFMVNGKMCVGVEKNRLIDLGHFLSPIALLTLSAISFFIFLILKHCLNDDIMIQNQFSP
jgi:hypothetical protein